VSNVLPASLRADPALGTVLAFSRRFGRGALELAMHAALPLGLSPELVHLLRVNFAPGAPFIAEADLLLSPLCAEVGGGMYEMDADVRELLLDELSHTPGYGAPRVRAVARFLRLWAARALEETADADALGHLRVQQWVGLAYDEPARAAEELARALRAGVEAGSRPEVVRVARLTGVLSAPLAAQVELRRYAGAVERVASARSTTLALDAGEVTIGRERLPAFGRVVRLWRPAGMQSGTAAPTIEPQTTADLQQATEPAIQQQAAEPGIQQQTADPGIQQQVPELDIQQQTAEPGIQQQSADPRADIRPTADELCEHLTRLGRSDNDLLCEFARAFYVRLPRHLLEERGLNQLVAMTLGAWEFLSHARPEQVNVQVVNPEDEGWNAGVTVIRAEAGDRPFIVDTIREYLAGQDLPILLYVYPVLRLRRDGNGEIVGVGGDEGTLEALTHAEVARVHDSARRQVIREDVLRSLADVVAATSDFNLMLARVDTVAQSVEQYAVRFPDRAAEFTEGVAFLRWLKEGNFVFLGSREYAIQGEDGNEAVGVVPGSGLGILRDPSTSNYETPVALRETNPVMRAGLMSGPAVAVVKTNRESTVHRRTRMDYVSIKILDGRERVRGEQRFLGLFTSEAYASDATDIPILRVKIMWVLERSGARPGGHDYREISHLLNTMPRDELFSASVEQLQESVKVALESIFTDDVRVIVRIDDIHDVLGVTVILPRGLYSVELRAAVRLHLEERIGGALMESHLVMDAGDRARLHFSLLMGDRKLVPDVYTLEREVVAFVGSWPDGHGGNAEPDMADGIEPPAGVDLASACVVLLPFGRRTVNGLEIDFDDVWTHLLEPAVWDSPLHPPPTPESGSISLKSSPTLVPVRLDGLPPPGTPLPEWIGQAPVVLVEVTDFDVGRLVNLGLMPGTRPQRVVLVCEARAPLHFPADVARVPYRTYEYGPPAVLRRQRKLVTKALGQVLAAPDRGPGKDDTRAETAPAPAPESRPERTRVFISYSHADAMWLQELQKHLQPLEHAGLTIWADTRLTPGTLWREELHAALAESKVAILLVSADYLASDFIVTEELPTLLRAAEQDGITILPVIIGPSRFEQIEGLARFQAVNDPHMPLSRLRSGAREQVLDRVARAVEEALTITGPGSAADKAEPATEPLFLAIIAPESARPGEIIQMRVIVAGENSRDAAAESLQREANAIVPVRWIPEWPGVPRGTPLEIRITGGSDQEPAITRTEWNGDWWVAETPVTISPKEGQTRFSIFVEVLASQVPVTQRLVPIKIMPAAEADADAPPPPRTAYACFAATDRERVQQMVSALTAATGLDVFMDAAAARLGSNLNDIATQEICSRDRFLLFWSRAAAASSWVRREWEQALACESKPEILVYSLEPVPAELTPPELRHLHFTSVEDGPRHIGEQRQDAEPA
jgi:hypothetical protein